MIKLIIAENLLSKLSMISSQQSSEECCNVGFVDTTCCADTECNSTDIYLSFFLLLKATKAVLRSLQSRKIAVEVRLILVLYQSTALFAW
eukprot:scaffold3532_cov78-Cylindrotheca_fusiformis.AAC.1